MNAPATVPKLLIMEKTVVTLRIDENAVTIDVYDQRKMETTTIAVIRPHKTCEIYVHR